MPTLTKNDIVNEISHKVGFKKNDSVDLIEKLLARFSYFFIAKKMSKK